MDAKPFAAEVRAAIQTCRDNVDAFLALPPETALGDVVTAFDRLMQPLNGLGGRVHVYTHMHPEAEVRSACEKLEVEIAQLGTEFSLHRGLFERLSALDPARAATADERRVVEHGLRDFRRSGVDRDDATRARITALQDELVKVGQEFDRNIMTGGRTYVVRSGHAGLKGCPADFLRARPEREDGTVLLSTDPAERMTVMSFCDDADVRREFHVEALNRAVPRNLDVLPVLLAKRHEMATLLGFSSWADYVTGDKMVTSAADVRAFLDRVIDLVRPRAFAEYDELLEKKQELDPDATVVHEWDRAYLTEKVKAARHGFDSQEARPYFPYASVLAGVLRTSAALYGVEFRERTDADVWHPSVRAYDVVDPKAEGTVVARFFMDMHPRDNKFKHAAMFHVAEGVAGETLPEACLACNFPEPQSDDPGLMLHDQVTTFFHEFGHLLHHLFGGRQRFARFSGIATESDFVEVPSQMYEEWAWSHDVLQTFARHHATGAPIPTEMVTRMRAAEEYGKGLHVLQQMYYARLSLACYDRDPAGLEVTAEAMRLKDELLPTPHAEGTYMHASFGHLHGYSAMYYTYMWSLVIAKDLFTRFEDDLMNTGTANEYRETILGPGGSKDAAELVRGFLGREYGFEAFESWLAR
jgi:thimet oligopeptidase